MTREFWRKPLLVAHIGVTVGLLGVDLALVALGIAGATGFAPETVYPATSLLARWLAAPLAVLALGSGVALGLMTPWGLFKHGWVVTKLVITSALTLVLLNVLLPGITLAAERALASPDLITNAQRLRLVIGPTVAATLLVVNVALATYKPRRRAHARAAGLEAEATIA